MATVTTTTTSAGWSPDLQYFPAADVIPEALIVAATTHGGVIQGDAPVLRVPYVDDDEATVVAEAEIIPTADPVLSEISISTTKVATVVYLSNEQVSQANTPEQIAASVKRSIIKKSDELFLAAPVPTPPAVAPAPGLLNVVGAEAPTDPVDGDLDVLTDLVATLEANGATPNLIVVDPTGWAALRKFKTADAANTTLLGAGTTDAQKLILGIPVVVNRNLTENTGLVIDTTSVIAAYSDIAVAMSTDAAFTSDSTVYRATFRFGAGVPRPDRLGVFSIGAATP